jgi:heme/copper-type cytochrome/quinol oxidase subunit 2
MAAFLKKTWFIKLLFLHSTFYILHLLPSQAFAQDKLGPGPAGPEQLQQLITRVIGLAGGAAFIVVTVILVWAGVKYITSGGEQKAIQQAHQTVTWAIFGLIFLAMAFLVLQLIKAFTGVNVTEFTINLPTN